MTDAGRTQRDTRIYDERSHDPYQAKGKLPEPTYCPDCKAVYLKGNWHWQAVPEGAHAHVCPACQRIRDRVPAGYLTLKGGYVTTHKQDILNLARNVEEREKAQHPLIRIMAVEEQPDAISITVTDQHLARAVGEAVRHAHQGDLDLHYTKENDILRVTWQRA